MNKNGNGHAPENQSAAGLNDQVYQYILDQIIKLGIEPGQRINTTKVAANLGVSRTPIRSAMDRLCEEGFVESVSDRGYRVIPIAMSDCFNLCDARKILEGGAAYMAANNIGAKDLEILEHSIVDAKLCLKNNEYDAFAEYDTIFHETLFNAANNRYLKIMHDRMKIKIDRYRYFISFYCRSTAAEDTRHALEKHSCIFRALKNRYSSVAQNEMEEHIAYTYRTLFNLGWFINSQRNSKENLSDLDELMEK